MGDKCTKEFFEYHAGQRKTTNITYMKDGDRLISTQPYLEEHILAFYEKLYTMDEQVEKNTEIGEECFRYLKQTVMEEQSAELLKPLTPDEVSIAMKQLSAGKTPRVDSVPAEFYQEL